MSRLNELHAEYIALWEAIEDAGDSEPMSEREMDARNNLGCWLEDHGAEFNALRVNAGIEPVRYIK